MIEVSLSLIGQEVKKKFAENSIALGYDTHNNKKVIAKKPLTNLYEMNST